MKLPPDDPLIRPARRWYWLPAALFVVCVLGGALWIVAAVARAGIGGEKFVAPGALNLTVTKPAYFQVWNETDAVVDGRQYRSDAFLPPQILFRITALNTGLRLPLVEPAFTVREAGGGELRAVVGSFAAPAPGRYEVRILGDFPPRVFSVVPASGGLLSAFAGGSLLCAFGGIAAPLIAFLIFTRRGRARRKLYGADC